METDRPEPSHLFVAYQKLDLHNFAAGKPMYLDRFRRALTAAANFLRNIQASAVSVYDVSAIIDDMRGAVAGVNAMTFEAEDVDTLRAMLDFNNEWQGLLLRHKDFFMGHVGKRSVANVIIGTVNDIRDHPLIDGTVRI